MIWMMLYVISLVLIKSSICMTMLRIGSPIKVLRVCVYVLLGLSVATFVATFVGILCLCRPVEANWNTALVLEGKATCSTMDAMIGLSYFSTASSIATDLACAVLPGLIVWNMQLPKKTKISVCVLLSFGSMACISTMIRTPYIRYYRNPTDNLVCKWFPTFLTKVLLELTIGLQITLETSSSGPTSKQQSVSSPARYPLCAASSPRTRVKPTLRKATAHPPRASASQPSAALRLVVVVAGVETVASRTQRISGLPLLRFVHAEMAIGDVYKMTRITRKMI